METPQLRLDDEFQGKLVELDVENKKFNRLALIKTEIYIASLSAAAIAALFGSVIVVRVVCIAALVVLTIAYLWWRKVLQSHFDRCNEVLGISFEGDNHE